MSVDSHIVDIQAVDSISDVNRFYQRVIIDTIHHETFITPPAVLVLHHRLDKILDPLVKQLTLTIFLNVKGLDCEIFAKFLFQERHRIPINKKRPQPDFSCLITGAKIRIYFYIYLVRTTYAY